MLFQTKMFPNTNQWYHMVITYTSSGMTIYRDGVVTTDGIYSSYCGEFECVLWIDLQFY